MKVLVGCEYSGKVRDAFAARGHDAISCDLLPTDRPEGKHYQGDVFDLLKAERFDLAVFHPPCTYLANSGVCWLYRDADRWDLMRAGARFFKALLDANIPKIAVENPIPHKYAIEIIGRKYDQIIQPWQFGHLETKATCLWLKNLKPLIPTTNLKKETFEQKPAIRQRLHYLSPGPERAKLRSETFDGIAAALAEQYG